ncbi:MAG: RidA family protein [Clostridia bacterium]|jgi:2-iminobutanoate/2-iminopropanoate deaminase|nr:RidA family protein [Clostridia bacterium]MDD3093920.1 RidA family protein [Clostridia bacterium]MDD3972369.1 RidA family protein [Clostridia bacterium]NLF36876.1 RidA family protein [Clostridiaceae bacterium]HXK72298.1 RidA family protein [Clostridia bacterium]
MKKKIIKVSGCPEAVGPYSQAVRANDLLFVSGNLPIDVETGKITEGGIELQTHMVLKNISKLLDGAGLQLSDIIKTTIFIKDMNDFAKVNSVYSEYFTSDYPARSTVEVSRLPKDALIEIECIAKY